LVHTPVAADDQDVDRPRRQHRAELLLSGLDLGGIVVGDLGGSVLEPEPQSADRSDDKTDRNETNPFEDSQPRVPVPGRP
jgi:hypothetical protein